MAAYLPANPTASALRENLAAVIRFAQERCGQEGHVGTQRDLAERLDLAPTMIGRYLTHAVDPNQLKLATVRRLAELCGLSLDALVLWLFEGQATPACTNGQRGKGLVDFSATELCAELQQRIAVLEGAGNLPAPVLEHEKLLADLAERRRVAGDELFQIAVESLHAESALQRVALHQALSPCDWNVLGKLLSADPEQLKQRYHRELNAPAPIQS